MLRAVLTVNVVKARRAASRAAATVLRVGTTGERAPRRFEGGGDRSERAPRRADGERVKARRAGLTAVATVLRVGTMVSVRRVGLKVAPTVASALRVALTVNAVRARRADLKAAAIVASPSL